MLSVNVLIPCGVSGVSPVCDPRRRGRQYRYLFTVCVVGHRPRHCYDAVCRIDVTDGSVVTWSEAPGIIPAGPVSFIPRHGAPPDTETDGVVLVNAQGADGRAVFVVLDAATLCEVARVVLPYRHCWSYRCTWLPSTISSL